MLCDAKLVWLLLIGSGCSFVANMIETGLVEIYAEVVNF